MPKITFSRTGQTFEVPVGTSFLDFCQESDAPHEFGCMVGSCGTCRLVLVAGAENVQPAEISPQEEDTLHMVTDEPGARLGCQLTVHGDITVRPADDR